MLASRHPPGDWKSLLAKARAEGVGLQALAERIGSA